MFPTREIWGSKDKTLNTLSICLLQNLNQRILLFYAIKKVKKTTRRMEENTHKSHIS